MPPDISSQIEEWRCQLLDTTKRNRLINFKTGRSGGIPLVYPSPRDLWARLVVDNAPQTFVWKRNLMDFPPATDVADAEGSLTLFDSNQVLAKEQKPESLDECVRSPRLRADHLLTEWNDNQLAARLSRLALNSHESLTEQGVGTLFIAFGFLRWFEAPHSQVEIRSPLLLVPVRLERDTVESPWKLQAEEEEVIPNHTLIQLLDKEFRIRLPIPEDETTDESDPNWRTQYFGEIHNCVKGHDSRWQVLDEVALGTFSFQKLAMWDDLGRNRDRIADHAMCRAIAGDRTVSLHRPSDLPSAKDLDRLALPDKTFHILDADSSQHEAIEAAKRGASLVLDGPPGTGKSQTIANVIAECLAAGKSVLFVSEKVAALEVVHRRLQDKGLADFCLACHSHKANKREVVSELGRSLGLQPDSYSNPSEDLQRLHDVRQQLNEYVRELHAARMPLGKSVHRVHGELAVLERLTSKSRCPIPRVLERDPAYLRHVMELLARLPDCQRAIADRDCHPWRGCRVTVYSPTLRDDVRHHFGRLAQCLTGINKAVADLHALGFCHAKPTRQQWQSAVGIARMVLSCLDIPANWFNCDPKAVAETFVQIDQLSKKYRQTLANLPEFAPRILHALDANVLIRLALPADTSPIVQRPDDTARSLHRRLTVFVASLKELHSLTLAVDESAEKIGEMLLNSLPPQPVKNLRSLARLCEEMAKTGTIHGSWWEAGKRKELQGIIVRYQSQMRTAQQARAELTSRLAPRAFASESAELAQKLACYPSWCKWFLAVKLFWNQKLNAQVSGLYSGDKPGITKLQEDMEKLAFYQRCIDFGRQVGEQYAAGVPTRLDGQPDWDRTLAMLQSLDRLEQMTKMPVVLQSALCTANGVDRPALASAAQLLAEKANMLRQKLEGLAKVFDLGKSRRPELDELKPSDLLVWLVQNANFANRQAIALGQVIGLLTDRQDVCVLLLPDRIRGLADLGKIRVQIAGLCSSAWSGESPPETPEWRDWSALRDAAEGLLQLLKLWSGPLPPDVVKVLTSSEVRTRLAEAVRQCDAACAGGWEESWSYLGGVFELTQTVSTGITIEAAPLVDLKQWLTARVEDAQRLHEWTQFCELEREVASAEVNPILTEVLSCQLRSEDASKAFEARFLSLWLDAVYERVSTLRQFVSDNHERLIQRFQGLDRQAVTTAASRIRVDQLSRPDRPRLMQGEAPGSSELGTLLREVNKKRRHLPLRKLFAALPNLLLRLKPCVMMSPLAVSTYLDTPEIRFDLVIFDEASQVRPHDAICAIYRGRSLIVAGDQKQLPPTSFFDRVLEDEGSSPEDDEGSLIDYESILDVCCTLGLLRRRLRWHYRSRREGLIAFSNRSIYGNELVTFPSVFDIADNPAVAFVYVPEGRWKKGASGGFNAVEARRTAELVLAHFRQHPDESLGVIAFSQRQQMRILDELEQLRKANPEMEEFFHESREEPFFVKNLENVQGDERDVIILGIGYGPDETGRLSMNFGPINKQGGERRLNVAVTRARCRMTVVSSMRAHDIDLSRSDAVGVKLLRAYLDYAERGTKALYEAITDADERGFDSPFEFEVYEELRRQGLTIHKQVGCSSFHVDLAVVDPKLPGRYLLGIECDGATYHSAATARDRDRLRQEVLESLGWQICRIWSTDWLRDRRGQIERVLTALEHAKRKSTTPERKCVQLKSW